MADASVLMQRLCGGIGVIALSLAANGCDRNSVPPGVAAGETVELATLPEWTASVELEIGNAAAEGHDFIEPEPLGDGPDGSVYVLDRRLREVRRFDASGRFIDYVVRPGNGPGEMRYSPFAFGIDSTNVWFSELQTGRVHYVAISGGDARTVDTGWSLQSTGVVNTVVSPAPGGDGYRMQLYFPRDSSSTALRPWYTVRIVEGDRAESRVIYEYDVRGSLRLDGGRTFVGYAGPADAPVVQSYGPASLLRIDRPIASAEGAPVDFALYGDAGEIVRARRLVLPPTPLDQSAKDSIEASLARGATLGGARSLAPDVRRQIRDLVSEIPDWRPAFDYAVVAENGSSWLRLSGQSKPGERTWMVVDSSFAPRARIHLPDNIIKLIPDSSENWWATMSGANGITYVARINFGTVPDDGIASSHQALDSIVAHHTGRGAIFRASLPHRSGW